MDSNRRRPSDLGAEKQLILQVFNQFDEIHFFLRPYTSNVSKTSAHGMQDKFHAEKDRKIKV